MPNRLNRNSDLPVVFRLQEEDVATGVLGPAVGLTDLTVYLALGATGAPIGSLDQSAAERSLVPGEYYLTFDAAALRADLTDPYLGKKVSVMLRKPGDLKNEVLDELIVSDWDYA